MKTIRFEDNEDLVEQFISNSPSFEFNPDTWISPDENISNKKLLIFLIRNIGPITNNEIYVRDVSFLGFPALSIYIPTMSKCVDYNFSQYDALEKWKNYTGQNDDYYNDIMSLKNLLEFLSEHPFMGLLLTEEFPIEYLLVLCYIVLKDYDRVVKFSIVLMDKYSFKRANLFKIIRDYYSYKLAELSDSEIKDRLNESYSVEDIEFFYRFNNKLSFKVIKQILRKKQLEKIDKSILEEINRIKENLQKVYNDNLPDQINLEKYFIGI